MIIKRGNWAYRDPGDDIPDGSTILSGNFCQAQPNTEILVGKTLTIRGGAWVNVKRDPSWTVEGGNWYQMEYCANLHPGLVAFGLPEEDEDCVHSEQHTATIDSVVVEEFYTYKDQRQ